jgi:uncharacterized protein YkwD
MLDFFTLTAIIFLVFLTFAPHQISLVSPEVQIEPPAVYSAVSPTSPISPTVIPRLEPTSIIYLLPSVTPPPTPTPDTRPWGVATQMSEHSWVIRVNNDPAMGSSQEILSALNNLRAVHGAQPLKTDPRLCDYAQKRADLFKSLKKTDEHQALADFLTDEKNYDVLGFNWIGENSSYGYVMSGVHLIEFVYNSDPDHSKNQLDPKWDHACVGVNSPATDLIFATSPR